MHLTIEKTGAREWDEAHLKELFSEGFPEFITADRLVKQYIGRVREFFADLDLMLVDEDGVPVASGWGVPIRWDGRPNPCPRAAPRRWSAPWRDMSGASPPTPW
ncbi:hypothetical protein [Streptomyces pseudogriseolus]|uniref:hypothetical protein n=1 Tax=Streptomyces pseudogriseolus TaxID=36817 RepID=UPI003FA22FC9